MANFALVQAFLQLDFETVSRTETVLWEFETGRKTLYNMLAKIWKGYQT